MSRAFLILAAGLALGWSSRGAGEDVLEWGRLPDLPDAEGFAGVFAGIVKEGGAEVLVVAGGANFPEARPWEKEQNPQKVYHRAIYTLALGAETPAWQKHEREWPVAVAYGMSVTLPERGTALFIGGREERALASAWEARWQGGQLTIRELRPLPLPLTEGAAALVRGKVVVAGGATNSDVSEGGFVAARKVFVLDPSRPEDEWAWEEWAWPAAARGRMHAVAGSRGDRFYLFGGRDFAAGEEAAENRFEGLDWLADCWALDVRTRAWERLADMPEARSAAPSMAVPAGVSHLLYLGGVPVPFLREQVAARPALNGQGHEHPGFPASILAYDTITGTWAEAGRMPRNVKPDHTTNPHASTWAPVTTPVVLWNGKAIVPTGEIKPGVRSPQVLQGVVQPRKAQFGALNWIVVAVYLLGMVGIGYWFMKREAASSTEAYFRGGQKIPFLVAGLSIFATVLSAITYMSIPARAYATDVTWYVGQLPILLIVPLVAFCYLPFFRKLDLTSAYLYLERRFNLAVRLFASISFIVFHVGRIAIVLYLPALALAAVSNVSVVGAVLIIGVLCVVYTVMGGIEAVVWTDAVQAVVLMGGAILCLVLVVMKVDGGVGGVWEVALHEEKLFQSLRWNNFDIADGTSTAIVLFVAFFFNSLVQYTSGQDVVQRYVTTRDVSAARKSLWTTMWMSVFGSMVFFALGVAIFAYYQAHPARLDPALPSSDSILPFFVLQQLPAGVAGLIIAAIFAASQSTVSSSLNSIATAWIKDFDARLIRPNADDKAYLMAAKIVVVLVGLAGIIVAIVMAMSGIENAFKTFLGLVGLASGSLGGLFGVGVFTRRANGAGAVAGAIAGVVVVVALKVSGAPVTGLLYAFIGFWTCFLVAYGVGLATGGSTRRSEGLSVWG